MRVTSSKRLSTDRARRGGRQVGQGGAGAFEIPSAMAPKYVAGATPNSSVARMDAIIALQSVGAAGEQARRRAIAQGTAVLDLLDDLKIQVLSGGVRGSHIGRLTGMVQSRPEYEDDRRLRDLLDHIDLRARVELAKLGRPLP